MQQAAQGTRVLHRLLQPLLVAKNAAEQAPWQCRGHRDHAASSEGASSSNSSGGSGNSSVDAKEAAKFGALAERWWDVSRAGPFAPLHALNPARCSFIRTAVAAARNQDAGTSSHSTVHPQPCNARHQQLVQAEPLAGLKVLDVGCGGGILSEPLARLGAQVHGIDVAAESVAVARTHAASDPLLQQRIRYEATTAEALAAAGARYDVVVASEVIEHVRRPGEFLATLAALAEPSSGQVIISTLNRTPRSYALAILGAERVLRIVPPGTHEWSKLITPQELTMMGVDAGLHLEALAGMVLDPRSGRFSLGEDVGVNYIALLTRQHNGTAAAV